MARKPLCSRVVTLGSSSQQAPTHEEQAHHEPLDMEEQLVVDTAVSGILIKFKG